MIRRMNEARDGPGAPDADLVGNTPGTFGIGMCNAARRRVKVVRKSGAKVD